MDLMPLDSLVDIPLPTGMSKVAVKIVVGGCLQVA